MKAFAAAVVLLALSAGAASATVHRHASLRAVSLTPPAFWGSGFRPHESIDVTLRGAAVPSVHAMTNARGRFRVRLAAVPSCRAWTVRALGARGEIAVYHHSRCASLDKDVKGVVRRGPTRNICTPGVPCNAPAAGVTVQALESGRLVAETTTDNNGRFAFSLADGAYTIRALGRGTEPKTVHVKTSKPVHLAFLIDTGIR
jgi:hypothetical protein